MRRKRSFGKFLLSLVLIVSIVYWGVAVCDSGYLLLVSQQGKGNLDGMNFSGIQMGEDEDGLVAVDEELTYDGLNYSLIDQLSSSYIKDLLSLYRSSSEGSLDGNSCHATVAGLLATQIAATGYYPGTRLPLSYLPFHNHKVQWGEPYHGLSAEDTKLRNFSSTEYKRAGGEEYNQLLHEKAAKNGKDKVRTPWGLPEGVVTEVAKCSKDGKQDFRYLPNCLASINKVYSDVLAGHGMQSTDAIASMDTRICDMLLAASLQDGSFAAVNQAFGVSVKDKAVHRVDTASDDIGVFCTSAYTSILSLVEECCADNSVAAGWMEIDPMEFAEEAPLIFVCKAEGWYLSQKAFDSIDNSTLRIWKQMFPDDGIDSVAECKEIAQGKRKDLKDAIAEVAQVNVTRKDTKAVYGTTGDYDDTSKDSHGFVYYVSDSECSLYTRSYADSVQAPCLVSSFEVGTFGNMLFAGSMGEAVFVSLLQEGGLKRIDLKDPSTYKNEIVSGSSNIPNGSLADVYAKAGLNATMISAERITLLNDAASMIGKTKYFWGGGHAGEIGPDGYPPKDREGFYNLDCSGFVSWCFMKSGYQDYAVVAESFGSPPFEVIDPEDLVPGDVLFCGTHVMIYVNIDSEGKFWTIDVGGGGSGTYGVYVEGHVGCRLRSVSLPIQDTKGRITHTSGASSDNRTYRCSRCKKLAGKDIKRKTYLPSGNSGAR